MSDLASIRGMVHVAALEGVIDVQDAVDWLQVGVTLAYEEEGWYHSSVGDTAYENLVDFMSQHLKSLRIHGRSKRWWESELAK